MRSGTPVTTLPSFKWLQGSQGVGAPLVALSESSRAFGMYLCSLTHYPPAVHCWGFPFLQLLIAAGCPQNSSAPAVPFGITANNLC